MLIGMAAGLSAVGNTDNIMERCALIDFDRYVEQAKSYGEWPGGHVDMSSGCVEGLNYRLYRHAAESEDAIVIYHGGGVNSAAGYDVLARQLAAEPTLAVCLVDIRGHGDSTGERGTVERPERIWRDVDVILAEMRRRFPLACRHLLGHSSGAGMLLNYLTRYPGEQQADSLIMLAPELGPFSGMARDLAATARFAQVRQLPFVANTLSGGRWFGHVRAVSLNFPPAVLAAAPDFVCQYSVNMANALTPRAPARQLAGCDYRPCCWRQRRMSCSMRKRCSASSNSMATPKPPLVGLKAARIYRAYLMPIALSFNISRVRPLPDPMRGRRARGLNVGAGRPLLAWRFPLSSYIPAWRLTAMLNK